MGEVLWSSEAVPSGTKLLAVWYHTVPPSIGIMMTPVAESEVRERILDAAQAALSNGARRATLPPLWDGCAAERIVEVLIRK